MCFESCVMIHDVLSNTKCKIMRFFRYLQKKSIKRRKILVFRRFFPIFATAKRQKMLYKRPPKRSDSLGRMGMVTRGYDKIMS